MLMNARNLSVIKSLKFNFELIRKLSTRTESTCWSCSKQLSESERKSFFCPCEKHVILPVNPTTNYFDMFDLKVEYPIEKKQMVKKFRDHMRKLHPDLFTMKPEIEKEYSSMQSSLLNKAFSTLNNPIDRGLYILTLKDIDYEVAAGKLGQQSNEERQKILMDILELNELIDEIDEPSQVEDLEKKLAEEIEPFEKQLNEAFKSEDNEAAVKILAKMKYYKNITERLEDLQLKFDLNNF